MTAAATAAQMDNLTALRWGSQLVAYSVAGMAPSTAGQMDEPTVVWLVGYLAARWAVLWAA